MSLDYLPTIIIGCGGTGVRTLRHIKAQGKYNKALEGSLDSGKIQLIGIDTDPKSNIKEEEIDANALKIKDTHQSSQENFPSSLPILDEFIHIDRERINLALPQVKESISILNDHDGMEKMPHVEHASIASWFPKSDGNNPKAQIGQYQSEGAGAAQMRPLGRMGFFLHATEIHNTLLNAILRITTISDSPEIRVYVICSLAGGTGSGMFWDVAFLLKAMHKKIVTTGMFMLDGPYVSVDQAYRVKPNVYAALQEIVKLKNWNIDQPYNISYPVGGNGIVYEVHPGDSPAYKNVYIYQDFKSGKVATDPATARIETSCFRLANNCLAMIREDVYQILDVGKNNLAGDSAIPHDQVGSDYVFSTSSVAELSPPRVDDIELSLTTWWVINTNKNLGNEEKPDADIDRKKLYSLFFKDITEIYEISSKELTEKEHEDSEDNLDSKLGADLESKTIVSEDSPTRSIDTIDDLAFDTTLFEKAKELFVEKYLKYPPNEIENIVKNLDTFVEAVNELPVTATNDQLRTIFKDKFPEKLLEDWDLLSKQDIDVPVKKDTCEITVNFDKEREKFVEIVKQYFHNLETIEEILSKQKGILEKDSLKEIKNFREYLKGLSKKEISEEETQSNFSLKLPQHFVLLSEYLVPGKESSVASKIFNLRKKTEQGHVERWKKALGKGCTELKESIHAKPKPDDEFFNLIWDKFCKEKTELLLSIVRKVLSAHHRNKSLKEVHNRMNQYINDKEYKEVRISQKRVAVVTDRLVAADSSSLSNDEMEKQKSFFLSAVMDAKEEFSGDSEVGEQILDFIEHNIEQSFIKEYREFYSDTRISDGMGDDEKYDVINGKFRKMIQAFLPSPDQLIQIHEKADKFGYTENSVIDAIIGTAKSVIQKLSLYLVEEFSILGKTSTGNSVLEEIISRCSSTVFNIGIIENSMARSNLIYISKKATGRSRSQDKLHAQLKAVAKSTFSSNPRFTSRTSNVPVLYFEDMFRSAKELTNIEILHRDYEKRIEESAFFHFDRRVTGYKKLIKEVVPKHPVFCGNQDCKYDLRGESKLLITCPGCHMPVWNRCGNEGCDENNLQGKILAIQKNENLKQPPYSCPTCTNDLKTYWWRCKDKKHSGKPIPTDKETCPQCIEEYRSNNRPSTEICRQESISTEDCPGCLTLNSDTTISVPNSMLDFFNNGVNGHSKQNFVRLAKENSNFPNFLCKNGHETHYLFPTCPQSIDEGEHHHLYKNYSGNFVCSHHPQLKFYKCSHCEYPILAPKENEKQGYKEKCPRCTRDLMYCHYCSDQQEVLYEPAKDRYHNKDRCPNCSNLFGHKKEYREEEIEIDLKRAALCRSLFTCHAGMSTWETSAEFELINCKACREPVSTLYDRHLLNEQVSNCAFCLTVIGIGDRNGDGKFEEGSKKLLTSVLPEQLRSHDGESHEFIPFEANQEHCSICGTHHWSILSWMHNSKYSEELFHSTDGKTESSDANGVKSPRINIKNKGVSNFPKGFLYQDALEIFHILRSTVNNLDAYKQLRKFEFIRDLEGGFDALEDLERIFKPGSIQLKSFKKRIEAIKRHSHENKVRSQDN